jgi:hypothetical protein
MMAATIRLQSVCCSGVVTISKGERKRVLDLNEREKHTS